MLKSLKLTSKRWIDHMVGLPETGMGYHIADITLKDGRVMEDTFIENSDTIQLPRAFLDVVENDIADIVVSD